MRKKKPASHIWTNWNECFHSERKSGGLREDSEAKRLHFVGTLSHAKIGLYERSRHEGLRNCSFVRVPATRLYMNHFKRAETTSATLLVNLNMRVLSPVFLYCMRNKNVEPSSTVWVWLSMYERATHSISTSRSYNQPKEVHVQGKHFLPWWNSQNFDLFVWKCVAPEKFIFLLEWAAEWMQWMRFFFRCFHKK